MIIKLTRSGGIARYIEASQIFQQSVASGRVDLEIISPTGENYRLLVGEFDERDDTNMSYHRAYVMEHGKTVDTIRGHALPMAIICDKKPGEVIHCDRP